MGDENDSLVHRVRRSLEKSGYPLEMRVARLAHGHRPTYVHQSRYYVDPTTGKIRETDVLVCWTSVFRNPANNVMETTAVYLVVECKSKPAPWVVFDEGIGVADDPELRLDLCVTVEAPGSTYLRERLRIRAANGTLFAPSRIGTGIAEPTANSADKNPAWAAVQSAVAAAHGFLSDAEIPADEQVNIVVQPVVVTSGGLCRAYLDDVDELQVEEVHRAEVTVRPNEEARMTRCLVVTEKYVDELMKIAAFTSDFYGFRG